MRRKIAALGLMFAVAGGAAAFSSLPAAPSLAASSNATFVVPSNDGYGIGECVASGSSCGQVVADAWCEAQGFARSASFGVADVETTGSVTPVASRPISVTCAE